MLAKGGDNGALYSVNGAGCNAGKGSPNLTSRINISTRYLKSFCNSRDKDFAKIAGKSSLELLVGSQGSPSPSQLL